MAFRANGELELVRSSPVLSVVALVLFSSESTHDEGKGMEHEVEAIGLPLTAVGRWRRPWWLAESSKCLITVVISITVVSCQSFKYQGTYVMGDGNTLKRRKRFFVVLVFATAAIIRGRDAIHHAHSYP